MRKVNEENTRVKTEQILKAALSCFANLGLQKTTMRDICNASRMRAGHINYYFPTKDSIIRAVYELCTTEFVDHIEKMLDGGDFINAVTEIHASAEMHRRAWNITPGLRLEFLAEATRNEDLMRIYVREEKRISDATLAAIKSAISRGTINPNVDAEVCRRAITLLWSGFASLRIEDDFSLVEYRKVIALLLDSWLVKA